MTSNNAAPIKMNARNRRLSAQADRQNLRRVEEWLRAERARSAGSKNA